MVQHGLVVPIVPPPSPDRPTFLISTVGSKLAAQSPAWFVASAGAPTRVDCHSTNVQAAGGCEVDVTITAQLNDAVAMVGPATLAPIKVKAIVAQTGDAWEVRELRPEGAISLHQLALTALLGDEKTRNVARRLALANLDAQNALNAAPADAAAPANGPAPDSPPADIAPVAPVVGDTPYAARPNQINQPPPPSRIP
jgi:hypothetical protein